MDIKTFQSVVDSAPDQFKPTLPKFAFALRADLVEDKRFLPTRGTEKATGWDVRAAMKDKKALRIKVGQKVLIPLGIRGFCPEGWWYELKPRSSTFGKKSLHCLYGTIDEDYEGELLFACQFIPDNTSLGTDLVIDFGDALGQIIPKKRNEIELVEVSNEEIEALYASRKGARGDGGFGSTGK